MELTDPEQGKIPIVVYIILGFAYLLKHIYKRKLATAAQKNWTTLEGIGQTSFGAPTTLQLKPVEKFKALKAEETYGALLDGYFKPFKIILNKLKVQTMKYCNKYVIAGMMGIAFIPILEPTATYVYCKEDRLQKIEAEGDGNETFPAAYDSDIVTDVKDIAVLLRRMGDELNNRNTHINQYTSKSRSKSVPSFIEYLQSSCRESADKCRERLQREVHEVLPLLKVAALASISELNTERTAIQKT